MGEIKSYRDLKVWQDAMTLAANCYRLAGDFPRDELYGLTSQIRRAAVSIAANIAEGYGRNSRKSYVNFLRVAQGSLKELETHLLLSKRLGLASGDKVASLLTQCDSIGRMLLSLVRKLSQNHSSGFNSGDTELRAILDRIESRRQQLDLSENAISMTAGKPNAIRDLRRAIESGSRDGMSTATLAAIAGALGVGAGWLLTGLGPEATTSSSDVGDGHMLCNPTPYCPLPTAYCLSKAPNP